MYFNIRFYYKASLLFCLSILLSCSTSNQTTSGTMGPESVSQSATIVSAKGGDFLFHLKSALQLPNGMTQDDFNRQRAEADNAPEGEGVFELKKKIDGTADWMTAHKFIQEYIAATKGGQYSWYHHQLIAATTLDAVFSTLPINTDVQKAIEYYVDVLLSYNNTNEVVAMAKVLPMMQGYWSREKLAQVANLHFKKFEPQLPPSVYVSKSFISRAEEQAKKSSEQYSTPETIMGLSRDIKKQFWQDYFIQMIQRSTEPRPAKSMSFTGYSKAIYDSRLVIAILATPDELNTSTTK